jgi:hypothetical protein
MDNEFDMLDKMTSNQQLALTLRNWTDIPDNDHLIINEGIVSAINALSHMEDPSIRCVRYSPSVDSARVRRGVGVE